MEKNNERDRKILMIIFCLAFSFVLYKYIGFLAVVLFGMFAVAQISRDLFDWGLASDHSKE